MHLHPHQSVALTAEVCLKGGLGRWLVHTHPRVDESPHTQHLRKTVDKTSLFTSTGLAEHVSGAWGSMGHNHSLGITPFTLSHAGVTCHMLGSHAGVTCHMLGSHATY